MGLKNFFSLTLRYMNILASFTIQEQNVIRENTTKFSHAPLTDETQELLAKVSTILIFVFSSLKNTFEPKIENLKRHLFKQSASWVSIWVMKHQ